MKEGADCVSTRYSTCLNLANNSLLVNF